MIGIKTLYDSGLYFFQFFGVFIIVGLFFHFSCKSEPQSNPKVVDLTQGTTDPGLTWSFFGCDEVRDGPLCEVTEQGQILSVWARHKSRSDLVPKTFGLKLLEKRNIDGGIRWQFQLVKDEGEFLLSKDMRQIRAVPRSLQIRRVKRPECLLSVSDYFSGLPNVPKPFSEKLASVPAEQKIPCVYELTRRWERNTQDGLSALEWMDATAQAFAQFGLHRAYARAKARKAWMLMILTRFDEAASTVEELVKTSKIPFGIRLPLFNVYGAAQADMGNLTGASQVLHDSELWSRRLGDSISWLWAARLLLPLHENLGAYETAQILASELIQRSDEYETLCQKVGAYAAVHWWSILMRTRGMQPIDEKIPSQVSFIKLPYVRDFLESNLPGCSINLQSEVYVNLAVDALFMKKLDQANTYLGLAEAAQKKGGLSKRATTWNLEARIHWALTARQPQKALDIMAELEANPALSAMLRWQLAVHKAEAYRQIDDASKVLASWRTVQELAELWPGVLSTDREYGGLASSLHRSVQKQVGWLVEHGDVKPAIELARWARRRQMLAARRVDRLDALKPDERRKWKQLHNKYKKTRAQIETIPEAQSILDREQKFAQVEQLTQTAEELSQRARALLWSAVKDSESVSPKEGELFVIIHPGRNEWLLMVTDGVNHMVNSVGRLDSSVDELRTQIEAELPRLDTLIDSARVIKVMALGMAEKIDVHALRWREHPLLTRKVVLYSIDMPISRARNRKLVSRSALLVADPGGQDRFRSLPAARKAAHGIKQILEGKAWTVDLISDSEATYKRLLRYLPQVDLFQFGGHTISRSFRREDALELASQQQFTARDILALEQTPLTVFLASCWSGLSESGAPFSLAQAFVLGGSSMVLASSRPIEDEWAAVVTQELHAADGYTGEEAARVLGRLAERSQEDWSAFRVYVP